MPLSFTSAEMKVEEGVLLGLGLDRGNGASVPTWLPSLVSPEGLGPSGAEGPFD